MAEAPQQTDPVLMTKAAGWGPNVEAISVAAQLHAFRQSLLTVISTVGCKLDELCAPRHEAIQKEITISNPQGLYTRRAAMFARVANHFHSCVSVASGSQEINGKNVMDLMLLCARKGVRLTIRIHGPDAREAFEELERVMQRDCCGVIDAQTRLLLGPARLARCTASVGRRDLARLACSDSGSEGAPASAGHHADDLRAHLSWIRRDR